MHDNDSDNDDFISIAYATNVTNVCKIKTWYTNSSTSAEL